MSDTIGRITITAPTPTLTFPLVTDFAHGKTRKRQVITHTFGSANAKIEQRYHYGDPAMRYLFHRQSLNNAARKALWQFWESVQGTNLPFFYAAPNEDGTTTTKTVCFENTPLSFEDLSNTLCSVGLTLVEIPTTGPTYTVNATVTRFPGTTLATALTAQTQEIIPLVRIRVLDSAVPDIFLSDRRVTIGAQLYLPRLLRMNEPGSTAIVTQSIDGSTDDVTLTFGNADRAMVQVANDTQLRWARVELSLFHVDDPVAMSGTILQLWAGYVIDWHSDAGPEFTLKASDILSALTLSSPIGTLSRTCWRRYKKDGCPATGSIDTTHFPSGDPLSCDNGYNTPNGCMAHQALQSFGATYCSPQTVVLRSGGLGFTAGTAVGMIFGVVGGLVGTALDTVSTFYPRTSTIADSIFGGPLAEIWHSDDGSAYYGLPVTCPIAAGRDEDQFYIALGIVGRGPLGAYTAPQMWTSFGAAHPDTFIGSTLDGMPNHGFQVDSSGHLKSGAQPLYGLRQALGSDPAGSADFFSLGRVATTAAGWFTQASDGSQMLEVIGGGSAYNKVFSAGTAFCEIRRTKPNSDPLTSPGQHVMIAMISQGLSGLVWSAPGVSASVPGCVNPVWIAVNTYLRAIGMLGASTATQEMYFDVAAAVAAGAIADATVPVIIGAGSETQFRFKGVINDRKPTRDWIQSVLNSTLGYYTWSFGKLKIGCRSNASAVSAFTSGNILFNSLQLTPIQPKFEKLTVSFSDQEYQFQQNTLDYIDQDLAARNNRIQNPLAAQFPVSGCPSKSQAARIAIGRAREEMGGAVQAEQDAARIATWKSTILALDVEAGSVVSIADPDVPGGTMNFRVQSMQINSDWSVNLMGKTVTASMYDATVGPKPVDVQPAPVPVEQPRDADVPPAPNFGVEASTIDPTVAQIAGLSFSDSANTHSIDGGNFTLYYTDPSSSPDFLSGALGASDATMHLNVDTDITSGEYVRIGHEIVLCGAPGSGGVVPITRAQLGTTAASATIGTQAFGVQQKSVTASFSGDFFNADPTAPSWVLDAALPNMLLCVVAAYATNAYGPSPITYVLAGTSGAGLDLSDSAARDLVVNVTNSGTTSAPFALTAVQQVVNVTATTQDCYLLLPIDSAMAGLTIVVNLSPGSTHSAYLRLQSGDTLQGSGTDYPLATPGTSITIEGT